MKKRLLLLFTLAALVVMTWRYLYSDTFEAASQLKRIEQPGEDLVAETAEGQVNAPPPLRGSTESAASAKLTHAGILRWTNTHRRENGTEALVPNTALDAAAEMKLKDLFAKQYFEHVSPEGIGPGTLAGQAGYLYVMVGENLALGNYENDQALVQAWMDSPGHRANILEPKFTEIGIAVGQGVYEGRKTWIAVQEFGRPQASCPKPDADLAAEIAAHKAELGQLEAEAAALKGEIEQSEHPRSRAEERAAQERIDRYNALAERINALIAQIQGEITVYNGGVEAYNRCATTS